jgi:hypothetical protein
MNCKNCGKALVWLAGALLAVSLLFPNGFPPVKKPAAPVAPVAPHATDAEIVKLLATADGADKQRVFDVYTALSKVLARDLAKPPARITTTEQWAEVQANTLQLAIDQPGKYPGLDKAIESVFLAKLGTDDVLPGTPDTQAKLIDACDTIASSALGK